MRWLCFLFVFTAMIVSATAEEAEQEVFSQLKRPEVDRFLLQVDRRTKSSFATSEAAEEAGTVIKNGHPILQVAVYDRMESVSKIIELAPAEQR